MGMWHSVTLTFGHCVMTDPPFYHPKNLMIPPKILRSSHVNNNDRSLSLPPAVIFSKFLLQFLYFLLIFNVPYSDFIYLFIYLHTTSSSNNMLFYDIVHYYIWNTTKTKYPRLTIACGSLPLKAVCLFFFPLFLVFAWYFTFPYRTQTSSSRWNCSSSKPEASLGRKTLTRCSK